MLASTLPPPAPRHATDRRGRVPGFSPPGASACHDRYVVALLIWVVFGVALAGAELFTGNFVLVMFAAGALAAAGAAGLGAGVVVQTIVFTVITALALAGIRPLIRNRLTAGPEHKMGVEAIEGSSGLVVQDVD